MSRKNNCMFALPHELTGLGECCGLFRGQLSCNGLGRKCTGYRAHNAESRKALAEAIAEVRGNGKPQRERGRGDLCHED